MSPASTDNGGRSSGGDEKLVVLSSASASDTATATGAAADAGAAAPVTAAVDQPSQGQLQSEQEPQLLVKEFPPPPNYYRLAAIEGLLTPPVIPRDAVARGTRKSRQEADRLRKVALSHGFGVETDAGGAASGNNDNNDNDDNDGDGESDNQDVTAVFGEIVEDPTMLEPFDTCPDPTKIRDEVQRLNRTVLQLFISLTKDLGGRSAGEIETSEKA
jgi:mediator of RNA polymerase II transcription subunit 7